jgi:hypothetical protein
MKFNPTGYAFLQAKKPLVLLHRVLKTSSRWWSIFLLFSGTFVNAIDRAKPRPVERPGHQDGPMKKASTNSGLVIYNPLFGEKP